jgi:hypothetical protein
MLPAAFAVVALLVLLFLWQYSQRDAARKAAAPVPQTAATTSPQTHQRATQPTMTASPVPSATAVPANSTTAQTGSNPSVAAGTTQQMPAPPTLTANTDSNAPALVIQAPPKPAPLRLQGIVFNPASPSAMISGKTVFVGDKLGEMRVVAINQLSATLVGNGETNVLTLAQ